MNTIRPYRNDDPPRLLDLWRRTQKCCEEHLPFIALSANHMQEQILGQPFFDRRAIMLAFEGREPVGYVHTSLNPLPDGSDFDGTAGTICFLCVDPASKDVPQTAAALIRAAEDYLLSLGVKTIYGGSPSPSVPFYSAFYGGGEPIGILHSDEFLIRAFEEQGYSLYQKTVCFHMNLRQYSPVYTPELVGWHADSTVSINEHPKARSWWEGCTFANGAWFDAIAYFNQTQRPIARLRIRLTYPNMENVFSLYGNTWLASLMELRVHPEFLDQNIASFLLEELLRYLAARNHIVRAAAHAAEQSLLYTLLKKHAWKEKDNGTVFIKEFA
ncbi:MAG: hypothetical protein LBH00_10185 [Planctomycetaceae bacterium]|jgi:ribosomal protein S18 acetylase RimI-like enzyme|nr:hypothetical protein [Planctomycetaceae bacterium]